MTLAAERELDGAIDDIVRRQFGGLVPDRCVVDAQAAAGDLPARLAVGFDEAGLDKGLEHADARRQLGCGNRRRRQAGGAPAFFERLLGGPLGGRGRPAPVHQRGRLGRQYLLGGVDLGALERGEPGNLAERQSFEAELAALCLKENVGVIPYYSLAAGFLTGKYRTPADFAQSPRGARMPTYLNARGLRILGALDDVSARLQAKPAQVALAWLMQRPAISAPIASASNPAQLEDLFAATRLRLDEEARKTLDRASAAHS